MRKLALLALLAVLAGCSKNTLDKKMAAELIQKVYDKDYAAIITDVGRLGSSCVMISDDGRSTWTKDLTPSKDATIVALQSLGYATVTPDGPAFWRVELTEKGKAVPHGVFLPDPTRNACELQNVDFRLGTREVIKVTDITGDEKTATVEYSWKWKTTELGQALRKDGKAYAVLTPDERKSLDRRNTLLSPRFPIPAPEEGDVITGTATFAKYADGWRPK
jgi:hypothetical protein